MYNLTCEDINNFYKRYINNISKNHSIENELLRKNPDSSKWIDLLYNKSNELRQLFSTNEDELNRYIRPFISGTHSLTPELCECFLSNMKPFIKLSYMDSLVTLDICSTIHNYLIENNSTNYNLLCLSCSYAGYFESILIRLDHPERAIEYYNEAISYTDKFDYLSDDARIRIVASYYNRLVALSRKANIDAYTMIKYYEEVSVFFNNQQYAKYTHKLFTDEEFEFWSSSIVCSVLLKLSPCYNNVISDDYTTDYATKLATSLYSKFCNHHTNIYSMTTSVFVAYNKTLLLQGKITKSMYFNILLNYYKHVDKNVVFDNPDFTDHIYIEALHHIVPSLIEYAEYAFDNPEDAHLFRLELSREVLKFVGSIPHSHKTSQVNLLIYELLKLCLKHIDTRDEMIDIISKISINRQISTGIHISMVSRISDLILRSIITHRPELLIGLPEINCIDDVKKRKKELYYHMRNSALCHDTGKIAIGSMINLQTRKLTDMEFEIIKTHPDIGYDILYNNNRLRLYADIARGHHKFANGKGGYPKDFDNTKSQMRIVIDIITISDCIDAATDTLGRNYAKSKTFYDVLEELNKDKGTRYSADIAELLNSDECLCECLCDLTGKGRISVYNKIYRLVNSADKH